jgi:hypothetical protein
LLILNTDYFRGAFGSSKKRKNKLSTADESEVEDMMTTPLPSPEDDLEASKNVSVFV